MGIFEKIGLTVGILFLFLILWVLWRREKSRWKICQMSEREKCELLNELIAPFGFSYESGQDIFISRIDAWQRREGYEMLFDRLAAKFNMVIDAFPVYFDYRNRTWMIEFWKGQYGINTGAEIGVYHANRQVPKGQRKKIHYNAVSDEEMPLVGMCLKRKNQMLFTRKGYHWWLTAFRMGMFSQPKDLTMYASITFHDRDAAEAFGKGLLEAGFTEKKFKIKGRRATVLLDITERFTGMEKIHRNLIQQINRFYCRLYRIVTAPFIKTPDRMLFLYEQLPWCFRHMLRLHSYGRKVRVKK